MNNLDGRKETQDPSGLLAAALKNAHARLTAVRMTN